MMRKPCPVHGTRNVSLIQSSPGQGFDTPAMAACVACMEEGATPGGTWAEVIQTFEAWSCKECGALVWDLKAHDKFHGVPAGRAGANLRKRYAMVADVPDLGDQSWPGSEVAA